jgi:hypothetical protein
MHTRNPALAAIVAVPGLGEQLIDRLERLA